ncbi:RNA pseudouridylate synthase domain-containing protein 1-like [Amphiura filiformis]|uniref:RNA pseudouridylate synthase domain-containing protein 1-like n=1 Tax=Amphiura filiformis TaxID=82378 RepID=UPI003B21EF3D
MIDNSVVATGKWEQGLGFWNRFWKNAELSHNSQRMNLDAATAQAPPTAELKIIYQSQNFIVVDKNFDVKINSDDESDQVTVATQLVERFPDNVDDTIHHKFRFVHRLDYSTSGALCIALNKKASAVAGDKFKNREVIKEYLALVRGHVSEVSITIDKPVYPNPEEGLAHMMCVADDPPVDIKTKSATTELEVLQLGMYDGEPATKVKLCPKTGRRHQLRVHCQSIGYPIVGDYTYSFRQDVKPYRMMLHSFKLTIPIPNELIDVIATDPFTTELDSKWQPLVAIFVRRSIMMEETADNETPDTLDTGEQEEEMDTLTHWIQENRKKKWTPPTHWIRENRKKKWTPPTHWIWENRKKWTPRHIGYGRTGRRNGHPDTLDTGEQEEEMDTPDTLDTGEQDEEMDTPDTLDTAEQEEEMDTLTHWIRENRKKKWTPPTHWIWENRKKKWTLDPDTLVTGEQEMVRMVERIQLEFRQNPTDDASLNIGNGGGEDGNNAT